MSKASLASSPEAGDVSIDDITPMKAAIEASRAALIAGDMPFGASLVSPAGELLLVARNNQVSAADCTGHAETVLVREATNKLGPQSLRGATVYASGEPCAMCSGAMFWAGVARVVFAASQDEICATLGAPMLPIRCATVLSGTTPPVTVDGPVLGAEALAVLQELAARGGG
jgi:tRNA(Arg) A34 adenosine deaminase TadA